MSTALVPESSALDRAGRIALGFVEEYGETALDIAKTEYLNILTFGGYSVFNVSAAARREIGVLAGLAERSRPGVAFLAEMVPVLESIGRH